MDFAGLFCGHFVGSCCMINSDLGWCEGCLMWTELLFVLILLYRMVMIRPPVHSGVNL